MNRLATMPLKVVPSVRNDNDPSRCLAVLHQIETMLATLAQWGQTDTIDVRRLPLDEREYHELKETLGTGELSAEVNALGRTRVRETAVSGVWWVTHYGRDDHVVAELIEVTEFPELLSVHKDDLRAGMRLLRTRADHLRESRAQ